MKLGINGLGRIGKLSLWHHVSRKHFSGIVANTGREVGCGLADHLGGGRLLAEGDWCWLVGMSRGGWCLVSVDSRHRVCVIGYCLLGGWDPSTSA